MVDFHSHILPGIDDGSRNAEQSLQLLAMLKAQGVDTVAATPHFYADARSVETFLTRRDAAYEVLQPLLPPDAPRILRGAEVRYYAGISRMENLSSLCLEGTRTLLLEMPFTGWTDYIQKELIDLSSGSMRIVLAHYDRYLAFQKRGAAEELLHNGIRLQVNADSLLRLSTRSKILRMMRDGMIHCIGSDCHNLTDRAPRIADAAEMLRKKLGDDFLDFLDERSRRLIAPQ